MRISVAIASLVHRENLDASCLSVQTIEAHADEPQRRLLQAISTLHVPAGRDKEVLATLDCEHTPQLVEPGGAPISLRRAYPRFWFVDLNPPEHYIGQHCFWEPGKDVLGLLEYGMQCGVEALTNRLWTAITEQIASHAKARSEASSQALELFENERAAAECMLVAANAMRNKARVAA